MGERVILQVLQASLLLVWSGQGYCRVPPPPAIGDIRLVPYTNDSTLTGYHEVLIYYSDGVNPAHFGGVCGDNTYKDEGEVICHQLGYEFSDIHYRPTNSPLWFNHIQCADSNIPHILRCRTSVRSSSDNNARGCDADNNRLLVKCNFDQPLTPYDGQVALCPTDTTSPNRSSTSYGLVGIYYHDYGAWKGINQKDEKLLGAYEADTICRQMGFTGAYPGTAVTRFVDHYPFSNCFSDKTTGNVPFQFQHGAWVTTDDIICKEPQSCLGCCLSYPHRGDCNACDHRRNLVIKCAFDPSKIQLSDDTAAGSEDACKLDSTKNVGHCESAGNSDEVVEHLKIALGIIASLLVLLGPCGCYCLCCCYKDNVHDRCKAKVANIRLVHFMPVMCCRERGYDRIGERVNYNREGEQMNQNQDHNEAA